jgi:hypothetical protein
MAAPHPGPHASARYEIRVDGVLGKRWTAWFEGLQVSSDGSQTVICGWLPDQPALHGVLVKVRDLGLNLISVRRLDPDGTPGDEPATRHHSDADIISAAPHDTDRKERTAGNEADPNAQPPSRLGQRTATGAAD